MTTVLILSFMVCGISFTITSSDLFEPLRNLLQPVPLLGKLFSCFYCISHWVAFLIVCLCNVRVFDSYWLLDYFLTAMAVVWLSHLQYVLYIGFLDFTQSD